MDFDLQLRGAIYRHFADEARPPAIDDMARGLGQTRDTVRDAYQRLYAKRLLVLMPDGESIRMAPPFSGIPTQHVVHANRKRYFANCAWDSFGIPAALHAQAEVLSRCEQTGEPPRLHIGLNGPSPSSWLFHAAVPAAHWWRDIVHT